MDSNASGVDSVSVLHLVMFSQRSTPYTNSRSGLWREFVLHACGQIQPGEYLLNEQ